MLFRSAVLLEATAFAPRLKALLNMIEETLPVPLIALDSSEHPYAQAKPFEGVNIEELQSIISQVFDTLLSNGWNIKDARDCVSHMEPFHNHGDLIDIVLEKYKN